MKNRKKTLIIVAAAVAAAALCGVIATAVINAVMVSRGGELIDIQTDGEKYDCILILGAGVRDDGTPSAMLADRLDRGIELYFSGASERILVSGDHGRADYDEVNVMKEYCVKAGVPSEAVFMDHAGFSTYDSVMRAKNVFCCESVLIVSQRYHLYRALYIADGTGLRCAGASADPRRYAGQIKRDVREYLARVKDACFVLFGVDSKYGGATVPISGNGDITNDRADNTAKNRQYDAYF